MRTIDENRAKERLSALLDEMQAGREVLITRGGKPLARLVPAGSGFDRVRARKAADGLRAASKGLSLGELKIDDLLNEGRR